MGCEFGQSGEWNENAQLDWWLLDAGPFHRGTQKFLEDLNHLYKNSPALWQADYDGAGFQWIDCTDRENSVLSFLRQTTDGKNQTVVILNLTPVPRPNYRIGLPRRQVEGSPEQRRGHLCGQQFGQCRWRHGSSHRGAWPAKFCGVLSPAVERDGLSSRMKLISWNVNGLRAVLKKNFLEFLDAEKPDILCLQETKCTPDQVEQLWPAHYTTFWNSAEKKGYSGTAIFTKERPLQVAPHIGIDEHDKEGRVLTAEYKDFFLVNVYVPNSKRELERLPYRQVWDKDFLAYLKKLEKKKPVIFCGDLNVAHTEIDLANPKANVRNHGFTIEERSGFSAFVNAGFVDTFREFEKGGGHYSWWSPMSGARPERRLAHRLLSPLASAASAIEESLHPPRHFGQRPLPGGD